MRMTYHNIVVA